MASIQRPLSSGSDGGDPKSDERKRKRMVLNRESAKRSRMKKQKLIQTLTEEAASLRDDNARLTQNVKATEEARVEMEAANGVLRAQTMELADRLRFLNSMLQFAGEIGYESVEIPQIPDTLLEPWRIPYPVQSLIASPHMFLHRC